LSARRWFEWHSWIGTTAGLLLFVICWSGTIAVFSEEIDWLLNPAERVAPAGEMLSWEKWQYAAQQKYPDLRLDSIIAPSSPRSAAELWLEMADGSLLRTYVDPYTARVTGQTSYFNVQRFFRSLHMCLFDPGRKGYGYYFVMSFSVLLGASLFTSLVFYRRWWRRFFVLHTNSTSRALWSDLHKLAGVWSLWFIAIMVVTGLWYLIEFAGVDFDYPEISPIELAEDRPSLSIDLLYERAKAAAPELLINQIYLPGGYYGDVAVVHGEGDGILVRDRANTIIVNGISGSLVMKRVAQDLGWPARWVDTADPLHFGNFGGLVSKSIWFGFGLLLSGLTLTGAYLHACRQTRHRGAQRRRAGVTLAYIVTAGVLIAACAGAVSEYSVYAPVSPTAATWVFIAVWVASTLGVLTVWMRKLL
jgi:uncharacterized iron-regulated membrane protein